ncbi:MAG: VWA domain-containing protein [Polyangiales bacterium]
MKSRSYGWRLFLWTLLALGIGFYASVFLLESSYHASLSQFGVRFERPWAALLLAGPLLVAYRAVALRFSGTKRLLHSRATALSKAKPSWKIRLLPLPTALFITALCSMVVALMGPQSVHARHSTDVDGIDIMLTLDMSGSMQAADIQPSRFDATKAVVQDFISRRPNDRIGAVVFAKDAYTLLPLTTDKEALRGALRELQLEQIDPSGTAIGNAIGVSLNRLKKSKAKSKVIILLTDGDSNAGNISPEQAAEIANSMNVRIYPILMGVRDDAPVQQGRGLFGGSIWGSAPAPINPDLLRKIAEQSDGRFFGVADREGLEESFHTILDQLEKSEIEDAGRIYTELYPAFLWPAFMMMAIGALIGWTILRRWP